jgi:hypothetical protein
MFGVTTSITNVLGFDVSILTQAPRGGNRGYETASVINPVDPSPHNRVTLGHGPLDGSKWNEPALRSRVEKLIASGKLPSQPIQFPLPEGARRIAVA